jgi:hypothetical protein
MSQNNWMKLKTITHRMGKMAAEDHCVALARAGCRIDNWVKRIFDDAAWNEYENTTKIDLVTVSNAQLGIGLNNIGASFHETCEQALYRGLNLCLLEDAPELRKRYLHQPMWERLVMVFVASGQLLAVLLTRDPTGLGLYGGPNIGCVGNCETRFIFRRNKKVVVL